MKFILPEKQGMPGVGFQLLVSGSRASILSIPSILLKQPGLLNPPDTMIDLLRIDKLGQVLGVTILGNVSHLFVLGS